MFKIERRDTTRLIVMGPGSFVLAEIHLKQWDTDENKFSLDVKCEEQVVWLGVDNHYSDIVDLKKFINENYHSSKNKDTFNDEKNIFESGRLDGFSDAYELFKQGVKLEDIGKMTLQQVKEKYFPGRDINELRGTKPGKVRIKPLDGSLPIAAKHVFTKEKLDFLKEKLAIIKEYRPIMADPTFEDVDALIEELKKLIAEVERLQLLNDQLRGIKPMEGPFKK